MNFMDIKWIYGILIAIGIAAAGYSVMQGSLNMVILSIVGVFTFTNALRAQAFRERSMKTEAKFMRLLAIFFGLFFIGFLIYTLVV